MVGSCSWRGTRVRRSQEAVHPAAKTTLKSLGCGAAGMFCVGLLVIPQPLGMRAKLHHEPARVLSSASETRSFHESVTAPEEQREVRRPFRHPPASLLTLRSPRQFSTGNCFLHLIWHLHHPPTPELVCLQSPRRTAGGLETVFGGSDWADSSKCDISLQPKMEHMVTCTQPGAPISEVLSLPVGEKKRGLFFFSPPAAEWPRS